MRIPCALTPRAVVFAISTPVSADGQAGMPKPGGCHSDGKDPMGPMKGLGILSYSSDERVVSPDYYDFKWEMQREDGVWVPIFEGKSARVR